jgi:hypothetical protein
MRTVVFVEDSMSDEVKVKVDQYEPAVLKKLKEIQGERSGLDYLAFMHSARRGQVREVLRALVECNLL